MNENCGVFAAYDLEKRRNVTPYVISGLRDLQHRGQLSAGITSFADTRSALLKTFKKNGLVHEVFSLGEPAKAARIVEDLQGNACIGHTRYATSGKTNAELAQPFEYRHSIPSKWFAFCFNGNVANYEEMAAQLKAEGYHLKHEVDTEILMLLLAKATQSQQPKFSEVFSALQQQIDGACNLAFLNGNGDFAATRDQLGFRPLCYGVDDNVLFVSSEDSALHRFVKDVHPIQPGEILSVTGDHHEVKREQLSRKDPAHCFLEYSYFSNAASSFDGIPIYLTRIKLGQEVAGIEDQTLDDSCVAISIPDSARAAGKGFADALDMEQSDGIIKNNFAKRTFIEGMDRGKKVQEKYSIIREVIDGKRVFLIDDSLVRATTLEGLVAMLRAQASPKEIHLRIACPPIFAPCFYGIDLPTSRELFASQFNEPLLTGQLPPAVLAAMAQYFHVDSIKFLPVESLSKAIGLETNRLCMACINGQYPTPAGARNYAKQSAKR